MLKIRSRGTKILLAGLLAAGLTTFATASQLSDKCDNCHGKDGNSTDEKVPSIAGFSSAVIEDAMAAYRNEERPADKYKPEDGDETDMIAISKKLSDDQVKEVAAHYAKQKFMPHKQSFDAALAKKGAKVHKKRCEKCHSDNGSNAEDDAAILAGQWKAYLKRQFKLIESGERDVPKKMKKKLKKLKDGDIEKLIEFYSSQQ
ncbi:c-type cytochrome [Thiolapillus sp.]